MITKGAPDVLLLRCNTIQQDGQTIPMTDAHRAEIQTQIEAFSGQGLRVLALPKKPCLHHAA